CGKLLIADGQPFEPHVRVDSAPEVLPPGLAAASAMPLPPVAGWAKALAGSVGRTRNALSSGETLSGSAAAKWPASASTIVSGSAGPGPRNSSGRRPSPKAA